MITKEILDYISANIMDDIIHIQDEDDVRRLVDYILNLYEEVRPSGWQPLPDLLKEITDE